MTATNKCYNFVGCTYSPPLNVLPILTGVPLGSILRPLVVLIVCTKYYSLFYYITDDT